MGEARGTCFLKECESYTFGNAETGCLVVLAWWCLVANPQQEISVPLWSVPMYVSLRHVIQVFHCPVAQGCTDL